MGVAAIWVIWPRCGEQTFVPHTHCMKFGFDWPSDFWEYVWRVWTTDGWRTDGGTCLYLMKTSVGHGNYQNTLLWGYLQSRKLPKFNTSENGKKKVGPISHCQFLEPWSLPSDITILNFQKNPNHLHWVEWGASNEYPQLKFPWRNKKKFDTSLLNKMLYLEDHIYKRCSQTRVVRESDYSPTVAPSEEKYT